MMIGSLLDDQLGRRVTYSYCHRGMNTQYASDKVCEEQEKECYTAEDLVFTRPDFNKRYYSENHTYVVFGHTPTDTVTGENKIFKGSGNICIDCGATFENGKLACLALETMEEFYV